MIWFAFSKKYLFINTKKSNHSELRAFLDISSLGTFSFSCCVGSLYSSQQIILSWSMSAAAAAKLLQSCPTLCDPIDSSPPDSLSLGFSRQEHWSGLPFPSPMHESEKWKWSCSVVFDSSRFPWTAAYQAPPPMGFSRQEYWSGVPLPSPLLPLNLGKSLGQSPPTESGRSDAL